jgi:PPOX class probable F420-dependent enzyme
MRTDPTECLKRLDTAMFGVLGTVDPDRGTHLVPVVFAVADDELVVPIDTVKPKETMRLHRVRNLIMDPRASLLVDHRADKWSELWWVRADLGFSGTVAVETDWLSRLADKYPQYQAAGTVESLLLFDVVSMRGWAAA